MTAIDETIARQPVTRFELWQTVMQIRMSMVLLERAIMQVAARDRAGLIDAIELFEKYDAKLGDTLDQLIKLPVVGKDD